MSSNDPQLHVIFLPYMAPGHMMPMVDMARLFAARGVKVTIITTTMNALLFQNAVDRDINSGRQIALEILRLPTAEFGLPEGCENISSTTTPEMTVKLFQAIAMLQQPMEQLLHERRPNCIVADIFFPWTTDVAAELGIPRLVFNGGGFFYLCVKECIELYAPHNSVASETETFAVPGIPHQIELTRSQLPDIVKAKNEFSALFDRIKDAERRSHGVLMNSFYELEPSYVDQYKQFVGIKAWDVGPVSLSNRDTTEKADRGNRASITEHKCLSWLDSKEPNSVLYVCFGSLTRFSTAQHLEIATALEASGCPFIWVVGKVLKSTKGREEDEWWLPEGFEARMMEGKKGLIIRGWAPQVLILDHQAIGGFLTHCGWNSILEGVSAGVPLITWPLFAEQFFNEKLITQVLKIGVGVGNKFWSAWATEDVELVKREDIEKAVSMVMDDGDDAKEMRKRAKQLGEMAKMAVEEGGSSYANITTLIEDIRLCERK
ncbi:hypothetical protein HHK36_030965 [Tetracentron sinense]|uniref:Glycosyltransferase n=1 Tax=Tetracentron sinense TaxID=13715 RepID=A0A834YA79_TETSI|nr:hypothetical protein HHK36_030965 [Tetracentron sinense]